MPNGSLQPRASDERGSQTQGSIEVAAERDGVCIATLRLRSTRQDAQINYLSTLSIFMKQTTYLATLPNPVPWSLDGAPIQGARTTGTRVRRGRNNHLNELA